MDFDQMEELLSYDPYAEAIKTAVLMGVDEQDARHLVGRGQAYNHIVKQLEADNFAERTAALSRVGDTHIKMDVSEYIDIALKEGFEIAYHRDIQSANPIYDQHFVLVNQQHNMVLNLDTQYSWMASKGQPRLVSTCNLFYCSDCTYSRGIGPFGPGDYMESPYTAQGGSRQYFAGNLFVKEGLKHKIEKLLKSAHFGGRWWARPKTFWLINHSDKHRGNTNTPRQEAAFNRLTTDRLIQMPDYVREIVGEMRVVNPEAAYYGSSIDLAMRQPRKKLFSMP